MNVYFISGLGADGRIFRNIRLPEGFKPVYINWLAPELDESLSHYALRLSAQMDTTGPFALVGLSMGGMMAVEIAKVFPPAALILISSVPTIHCLPGYYFLGGALRLHRVIPIQFFRTASIVKRFFTSESGTDKAMLREMISAADAQFIKWGMGAILSWKNRDMPGSLVHIHGSGDFILPRQFTKPTHIIQKGGHLMVLTRAKEINGILESVLRKEQRSQNQHIPADCGADLIINN